MPQEKTHDSLREIPYMNNWTDTEKVLHNLFTKTHNSAYSAGIQKGLEMAVGCVPEIGKRPFTLSRNEETFNEGLENGHNSCRDAMLEALEKLKSGL